MQETDRLTTLETQRSDAELLTCVAGERCSASFAEMVNRYEQPAYNIARNITRSAALAEEAVQEAMLRVWLSASRFDPRGSARGWILGIVAREALKKVRDRKKEAAKVRLAARWTLDPANTENPDLEQDELFSKLRKSLNDLPELNRQLAVLYFGAGMSQAQIGAEVNLSQRMVGYKLEETMKLLRARLAQAGLAATVPAFGGEAVADAVCSGYEAPLHLAASVITRLNSSAAHAVQRSARTAAMKSSGTALWIAGALTLSAAAGGWYVMYADRPSEPQMSPSPKSLGKDASPSPQPASPEAPFHWIWNFDKGPSSDFLAWVNPWKWERDRNGVGRMIAKPNEPANILINVRPPKRPFVIRFRARPHGDGLVRDNFLWADERSIPTHKVWSIPYTLRAESKIDLFFVDRYILYRTDGQITLLHEFEEAYPGDRLIAVISNFRVEEIEMRKLGEGELAKLAFEPKNEKNRMERLGAKFVYHKTQIFRNGTANPSGDR